jgi:hypothetical protein
MSDDTSTDNPSPAELLDGVPVLPLRDVVVYPHMVIPLFVGREKSIVALDQAMRADKRIMLVAQKQADVDDPKARICMRWAPSRRSCSCSSCRMAPSRCWSRASTVRISTARAR